MLIGLCSVKPQVGKSTAASYLLKNKFKNYEMSDWVVKVAESLLGYDGNKEDPKQRKKLQIIGRIIKEEYPDFWITLTLGDTFSPPCQSLNNLFNKYKNVKEILPNYKTYFEENNFVISGIRSIAEAEKVREFGGRIILIDRDVPEIKDQDPVECQLTGYKNFYSIISNNGSFEDLEKEILNISSKRPTFTVQSFDFLSTNEFGKMRG